MDTEKPLNTYCLVEMSRVEETNIYLANLLVKLDQLDRHLFFFINVFSQS